MHTKRISTSILTGILLCSVIGTNAYARVIHFSNWETQKGANVYFVPVKELPMLDIRIAFPAGSAYDKQHPGLANLVRSLLFEGTPNKTNDQITSTLDNLGAQYNSRIDRDNAFVSLRTLTNPKLMDKAINTFIEAISQANFPEAALERNKNQQIAALKHQEQEPSTIASKQFFKHVFGQTPYAHPRLGSADSVKTIDRGSLSHFHQRYYTANNAIIAIVGNISAKQANQLSERISNAFPEGDNIQKPKAARATQKLFVKHTHFPSTQTSVFMGELGIARNNPDYYALITGNYILGGGLISRLMKEVREERGLTYGISSHFYPLKSKGPFFISLKTKKGQAAKAVELSHQILTNFIVNGPTNAEMTTAKQFLTGSFPLNFDSNKDIANALLTLGIYHLPNNYYDHYETEIGKLSREDIKKAFQKHVHPTQLTIITVGPDGSQSKQS